MPRFIVCGFCQEKKYPSTGSTACLYDRLRVDQAEVSWRSPLEDDSAEVERGVILLRTQVTGGMNSRNNSRQGSLYMVAEEKKTEYTHYFHVFCFQ